MVDLGERQFGDRRHSLVVLKDPAKLAVRDAIMVDAGTADRIDQHEGELASDAARLELLDHPHQRHAGGGGVAHLEPPQELRPAQRKEPAIEPA